MKKGYTVAFVLVFLIASCIIYSKPVYADSTATENTWTILAPMDLARSYFGAVTFDGKTYVIGGTNEVATGGDVNLPASNFTGGVIGTNEVFDPATNTWTPEEPMPTARMRFAIAAYEGKIYCIGGNTQPWHSGWDWRGVTGVTEIYDPLTDTWQTGASMPYPVMDLQANVVNGKIYCVGGIDSSGVGSKLNQVYDPATNTWTESAPLPTATFKYASAVSGGKIYVINGIDWYSMYGLQLTQIYDPQNDSWSLGTSPPYTDNCVGTKTLGVMAPELIYAIGSRTQIYNPLNDSWTLGKEISPSRGGFTVVNIDDKLYVMGGTIITSNMNSVTATETQFNLVQQYTPLGYGTIRPEISILSPENQTYNDSSVQLFFTMDRTVSWQGYSLDGNANVSLNGNGTIGGITNGPHTITLYANDTYGNFASQTVNFTVMLQPFPTVAIGAVLGTAVFAVVIALLVLFKKRKNRV